MQSLSKPYVFSTNEFGISDEGIHLLRSGYNYDSIRFSHIDSIQIKKGMEHQNWVVIFIIGASLVSAGLYISGSVLDSILGGNAPIRSAKAWFAFVSMALLGFWFVRNSVRSGTVLLIEHEGKRQKFPLRDIVKEKKLTSLIEFLSLRMNNRLRVKMSKQRTLEVQE